MPGAISGVMPAHGASSSHDSRSPTTRSVPIADAHGGDHLAGEQQSILTPLVVALVGEPAEELAHQAVLAGVDLDAVAVRRRRRGVAALANPATTAAMSSASIHFGTSRVFTSGTRDGAHSSRWL